MTARSRADWERRPSLPAGHFVSGLVYTESSIYEDEIHSIFGKTWRLACHESELPALYDYRVFDHAGQSIICIRGDDQEIRTFLNVCPHRGAKLLLEPAGNARLITCFYHRWSFDSQGTCAGIPRASGYGGKFDKGSMGLREIRTTVKYGLIFVTLDDDAPELDVFIGSSLDQFSDMLGSTPLEVFHYNRTVLQCNWKAWHETNMDIYHEFMHVVLRQTQVGAVPMEDRRLKIYTNGHAGSGVDLKADYEGYEGFSGRGDDVPPLPGVGPTDFRFVDLFPSTAIISRGTVIRIDTATPIAPGKTLLEMRGLGVKGESAEHRKIRQRHHNQYWGPFGRNVPEDMIAAEACEASFRNQAGHYQIIARDEKLTGQDDAILRAFYAQWSACTGRDPGNPIGDGLTNVEVE